MNDSFTTLEQECDVEFYTAGGPGGQHRNRVATAVRLSHRPSGIVVTATERRSQAANRRVALERLAERLARAAIMPRDRLPTKPTVSSQRRRVDVKRKRSAVKLARRRPSGTE